MIVGFSNITDVLSGNNYTNVNGFEDSLAEKVAKVSAYCLLFVVSLTGNTLILVAIYRDKRLRTNTNMLIANMAASDLLFAVMIVPKRVVDIISNDGRWFIDGNFGVALCKLGYFFTNICFAVSIYSCVFIALDRYYAVAYPFKRGFSKSRLKYIMPGIWAFAALLNSYDLYNGQVVRRNGMPYCNLKFAELGTKIHFVAYFLCVNAIPFSVIAILYSFIVYKLRRHKTPGQSFYSIRKRKEQQNKKKIFRMSIVITGLLFGSWLLFDINSFWSIFGQFKYLPPTTQRILQFLGFFLLNLTVSYNFFICLIFNEIYRKNFKSQCLCFKPPNLRFTIYRRSEVLSTRDINSTEFSLELLALQTLDSKNKQQ